MASDRDIRRLAFLALFQMDAQSEADEASVRAAGAALSDGAEAPEPTREALEEALALARDAFANRRVADDEILALAPTWPAHRQPAVDRAILRLAHHEMTSGRTSPKVAVNEAVELAKKFSTERSPAFVNGVLDKVLKRVLAAAAPARE